MMCRFDNIELYMEKHSDFGPALRALRQQRRWTVRALAEQSGVSSVWITLVENGHRTIGLPAVEKLAAGLGLREPELTRFRLSGLAASERSDLLRASRQYGPTLNNALAMHLQRQGIRPRDLGDVISQPEVGMEEFAGLVMALEALGRCSNPASRNAGTQSNDGPFLEIRFKDGRRAWLVMLVTAPQNDQSRTGAVLNAARNPPRPLTRATGNRRTTSTIDGNKRHSSKHQQ
ncbi:MAG: XRE family transcriptional regulator [Verrucomicrobia bacterium]|nr:XRE family transcriptional regulator [Verrucomicrobiota bacterium]